MRRNFKIKNRLILFMILIGVGSCVDRLSFDVGNLNKGTLVIQGFISDQPGPYEVTMYRTSDVDDDLLRSTPYGAKRVVIIDDLGNETELTTSLGDGVYSTSEGVRGQVGRRYKLHVEAFDGTVFESEPDELRAVGDIDSIYWEWESNLPIHGETEYGFRVYLDTHVRLGTYLRWKYTGTYITESFPIAKSQYPRCTTGPNAVPIPCSGYTKENPYGVCTCCYCWVNDVEDLPHLSDENILRDGAFPKVEMGFVPFEKWRFRFLKYMIKVEQQSLSPQAYEFWKIIRDQKQGNTSLFQPAFGAIKTNIKALNSDEEVLGIFYATAIKSRVRFITAKDAPIPLPAFDIDYKENCYFWDACDQVWANASRTPPPEWE